MHRMWSYKAVWSVRYKAAAFSVSCITSVHGKLANVHVQALPTETC